MAGERTIRIKFDGTAAGLRRAANQASRAIDGVESSVKKKVGVFARIGQKIGLDLTEGIGGAFRSLPPQVQAGVAAAGLTIGGWLAGFVGAALSAGVMLGIGGGVLAAGIKAASSSPKVQAAWKSVGERAKAAFADFGKPFEGPLVRAAGTFGTALERMAPRLKDMGKSMAPIIDKLAPAFTGLAENALPGIQRAMEAGKPLWDKLAEHMPKIGTAMSKFFDKIAEGAPGAELFVERFLQIIETWLPILGDIIAWLSDLFVTIDSGFVKAVKAMLWLRDKFVDAVKWILNSIGTIIQGAAKAFGWIPGLGPKLKAAAAEFETFRKKANRELEAIKDKTVYVRIRTDKRGTDRITTESGGGRSIDPDGRRALGGPVVAGRSYLVGERGPELFTPGASGHITPNSALGPDVLNLTLDLGHGIQQVVQINLREERRQLRRAVTAGAQ